MTIRQLHIGFGAFARAHPVLYTDIAAQAVGAPWPIAVARLNSGADALTALDQAKAYTVAAIDDSGADLHRVTSVAQTVHPLRDGPDALPDVIAAPELSVITLTITEKGYGIAGGALDDSRADLRHDLAQPQHPRTAIGAIVEGLRRRHLAGLSGLSILSCDNLPDNGALTRTAVLAMARAHGAPLAEWVAATCAFPSTMVDRIVPAMTEASHQQLAHLTGAPDPNGILCEPFRQWVIQDDFAGPRPAWEQAGAQIVTDVAPFEEMKLRMLNGAHSFLAYLGSLAGVDTVAACMQDPVLRGAAHALMTREQAPTLAVPGVDLPAYADALIARFGNSHLQHKTLQIATDGSQKLPQRLIAPLADNLHAGRPAPLTALAIAGWMAFVRQQGAAVADPLAQTLAACASSDAPVDRLLALPAIFAPERATAPGFRDAVHAACQALAEQGPRAAIAAHLDIAP